MSKAKRLIEIIESANQDALDKALKAIEQQFGKPVVRDVEVPDNSKEDLKNTENLLNWMIQDFEDQGKSAMVKITKKSLANLLKGDKKPQKVSFQVPGKKVLDRMEKQLSKANPKASAYIKPILKKAGR